ncbi:MAG: SAF domain-containing protein [Acidobacteriota bacterium]|nr:SAF domain-containing protein [Acidobacteriota bacterium]
MRNSLLQELAARAEADKPLRVGVIGAGKFATMFFSQARRLNGLHLAGVVDLARDKAVQALRRAGWPDGQFGAGDLQEAMKAGTTWLSEDSEALLSAEGVDVIVEATGDPVAGIGHALKAINQGKHLVMVNVEADVVAGPLLARRARQAGVVYSLAYGDQPALICELVDWARCSGFEVVCAGKGTKYLPAFHASTPDTVWEHYGFSQAKVAGGELNPRMFNSFLDGTKSAIEMAAVANASGLQPQPEGLNFPPCGQDRLAEICRPRSSGGCLSRSGTVEVVSSLERDGHPVPGDLRWGVYVTFEAPNDYVKECFTEYGLQTDDSSRYAALYRPVHLVGMELSVSVLKAGLAGEATGCPATFAGDVVATAKRDLSAGEVLDGEGGYTVYGRLQPSAEAMRTRGLPIGLAHKVTLLNDIPAGSPISWSDVRYDAADPAVLIRREMERTFAAGPASSYQ